MKRSILMGALEELDEVLNPAEPDGDEGASDVSVDAALIAMMEAEADRDEQFSENEDIEEKLEENEAAIERLEALRDVIVKYGISAPTMEAADPYRELVDAGICPSYEELGDVSVKDDTATAAIEGIDNTIESAVILAMRVGDAMEESVAFAIDLEAVGTPWKNIGPGAGSKIGRAAEKAANAAAAVGTSIKGAPAKIPGAAKAVGGKIADAGSKVANASIKSTSAGVASAAKSAGSSIAGAATKAGTAAATAAKSGGAAAAARMSQVAAAARALTPMGALGVVGVAVAAAAVIKLAFMAAHALKTHKMALDSVAKKLAEGGEFDNEKFTSTSVSAYEHGDYQKAVKAGKHIVEVVNSGTIGKIAEEISHLLDGQDITIEKVNTVSAKAASYLKGIADDADVKEILGLSVSVGDGGSFGGVSETKPSVVPKKATLGELGWHADNAKEAVSQAMGLTKEAEMIERTVKASVGRTNSIVNTLKKRFKKDAEISGEEKAACKQAINDLKKVVNANKTITKIAIDAVYKVNGVAVRVAKAAISSK